MRLHDFSPCHSCESRNPEIYGLLWILTCAGYLFSPEKAIPIPIYDNRDEAATHLWPILMGGSLKRSLGMAANAGHWLNMYCAGMTK